MTAVRRTGPTSLYVLIVSAVLTGNLAAQRSGAGQLMFGNHAIEVHIMGPSGAPLNLALRVEVLTDGGMHIAESYSNREEGVADFDGFNDGYFQLRITGPQIETVTQGFQIAATEATHREYVRVQLKDDNPSPKVAAGDDPTVSARDLAVPAKAREEFERGMEAHAKGDDKTAQEALERAIEIYPSYVSAHNNLGVLYLNAGVMSKASVECGKAVALDPKFTPGYVNLAKVSIATGDLAAAEVELKKAIAVDSGAIRAMVLLCSTRFMRKEYGDALSTARRVHEMTQDPQHADVHLVSANILIAQKKPREAAAEYQMFVKERPSDPRSEKVKSLIAQLSAQ